MLCLSNWNVAAQGLRRWRNFEIQETKSDSSTQRVGDFGSWFPEYNWAFFKQMFLLTTKYLAPVSDSGFLNVFDFLSLSIPVLNLLKLQYIPGGKEGGHNSISLSLLPLGISARLATYYYWKLAALKGERLPQWCCKCCVVTDGSYTFRERRTHSVVESVHCTPGTNVTLLCQLDFNLKKRSDGETSWNMGNNYAIKERKL